MFSFIVVIVPKIKATVITNREQRVVHIALVYRKDHVIIRQKYEILQKSSATDLLHKCSNYLLGVIDYLVK